MFVFNYIKYVDKQSAVNTTTYNMNDTRQLINIIINTQPSSATIRANLNKTISNSRINNPLSTSSIGQSQPSKIKKF